MTTLAQLKKYGKKTFVPFLNENGFQLVNKFNFVKEGPEEINYALFFDLSYGTNLKVKALCHTDDMNELIGEPFPKFASDMVGGMLKPGEPVAYENGFVWDVESEDAIEKTLDEIKICITQSALPFFESIDSREKLVDFIYPSMLVDDYKVVADKILEWKP